jgi:hypothetical protein
MAPQGTEDFVACHYTKTGIFLYGLLIICGGIIILEETKRNRRSRRVQCTCVEKTLENGYPCEDYYFLDGGLSMGLFLSLVYWKIVILVNSVDATKLVKVIGISYSHAREQKKFGIILVWTRRLKVQIDRVRSGYNN